MVTQKGPSEGTWHGSFHEWDSFLRLRVEYLASCLSLLYQEAWVPCTRVSWSWNGEGWCKEHILRGVLQKMFPMADCASVAHGDTAQNIIMCRTAGSDRTDGGWCFLSPNQRYNETRKEITTFFQALRSGRKQKSVGNVWPAKSQHRRDYSGEFLGAEEEQCCSWTLRGIPWLYFPTSCYCANVRAL